MGVVVVIGVGMGVVLVLGVRMLNTGNLGYKLIFGLIIGGALGNLIDRARHSGYVVDFISFNIPQIGFHFAIFNLADAAISFGVFLLFVALLFSILRGSRDTSQQAQPLREPTPTIPPTNHTLPLHSSHQQSYSPSPLL